MSNGSKLFLGNADHGARISHEEFAEADYEEPWRYERVNGRLIVLAPSGHEHKASGEPLLAHFFAYKLAHPETILHVFAEAWIRIDDKTERIADVAIYLKSPKTKGKRVPELMPEIVVETANEGYISLKRDYEEKREDYERAGVKEYVIVDRFDHRVTVSRRSRGKFVDAVWHATDTCPSPLLPGPEIPLAEVIG